MTAKDKAQMRIIMINMCQVFLFNGFKKLVQEKEAFGFFKKKVLVISYTGIVKSTTVDLICVREKKAAPISASPSMISFMPPFHDPS